MRQVIQARGSECVYSDVATSWTVGRPKIERVEDDVSSRKPSLREARLAEATKRYKKETDFIKLLARWGQACNHQSFITAMKRLKAIYPQGESAKSIKIIFSYAAIESVLSDSTKFGVLASLERERDGHDAVLAIAETIKMFSAEFNSKDPSKIHSEIVSFFHVL